MCNSNKMGLKILGLTILFACALLLPIKGFARRSKEKCVTPDDKQGECVLLTECSQLQYELQHMDSPEKKEYLQSFECESTDPKFCCPLNTTENSIEKCTTPNNKEGECIPLTECPRLQHELEYMESKQEKVEYLQSFECDSESSDGTFCCPSAATEYEYVDTLPGVDVCGLDGTQRISGGERAGIGEFPWMALLEYKTRTTKLFRCGGVLINSRYVLTAAHCVKGKDIPSNWRLASVRLGEYDTSTAEDCILAPGGEICSLPPLDVAIEDHIVHEDYNPHNISQHHDIALLRLAKSVPRTDYVSPICLPKDELLERSFIDNKMYVAGWGVTENKTRSNVLLKLEVKVKPNSDCASVYKTRRIAIQEGQLCAGGIMGQDSCSGDSGGPLMQSLSNGKSKQFYALGIVSLGPTPCGQRDWPGVYTRITNYMPWIISKLKP